MEVVVKVEDADPSFLSLNCDVKQAGDGVVLKEENAADDADATLPGYSDASQQVAMARMVGGAKGCSQPESGHHAEPEETGDWSPSHHRMCSEPGVPRNNYGASERLLPVLWDPRDAGSYSGQQRKPDLMDKLRERERSRSRHSKVQLSNTAIVSEEEPQHQQRRLTTLLGNKNAAKHSRLIEFGWMHNGRQVRSRGGGGTRRLVVPKNAAYDDLFRLGKELFFPEGFSRKGSEGNFLFHIRDYSGTEMPRDATVGALYEPLKHGMLRLYLCSLDRTQGEGELELEMRPDSGSESCGSENVSNPTRLQQQGRPQSTSTSTSPLSDINSSNDFARDIHGYPDESYHFAVEAASSSLAPSLKTRHHHAPSESNSNGGCAHKLFGEESLHLHVMEAPPQPKRAREEMCQNSILRTLRLRRINIVHDMIKHFKDPGIVDATLSVTFLGESGIDTSCLASTSQSFTDQPGIDESRLTSTPQTVTDRSDDVTSAREAYYSFWASLLQTNTAASAASSEWERVPSLRPDRRKMEWEAVGRILLKGYQDLLFFPTSLALPFTVCLVHGEEALTPDMLTKPFLRLIASPDRDILCAALEGGTYEVDGLLDVLHRMCVGTLPDGGSVKDVVARLAHTRFVQEPMYALLHMTSTAQMGLKRLLPTVAAVAALYDT